MMTASLFPALPGPEPTPIRPRPASHARLPGSRGPHRSKRFEVSFVSVCWDFSPDRVRGPVPVVDFPAPPAGVYLGHDIDDTADGVRVTETEIHVKPPAIRILTVVS